MDLDLIIKNTSNIIIKKTNIDIKKCRKNTLRGVFYFWEVLEYFNNNIKAKYRNVNIIQKQLDDAEKQVNERKSGKGKLFQWLFFLLNIIIVAAILINQLVKGEIKPISELMAQAPMWRFITLALGVTIFAQVIEAVKVIPLIYKSTKKFRPLLSYKSNAICGYYDSITPLSTGGQPFQIYYLTKRGIKGDVATGIPLAKYMGWQITFLIISTIIFIVNSIYGFVSPIVVIFSLISYISTAVLFTFALLISINKKIGIGLISGLIKLGSKLKIIKRYRKMYKRSVGFVTEYQTTMKSYIKNWKIVLTQIVCVAIDYILDGLVIYCIYLAFNPIPSATFWPMLIQVKLVAMASGWFPLPGGTGVSELSFNAVFASFFSDGVFFWALMIWRFCTYYYTIVQGLIIIGCDAIFERKNKINNKNKYVDLEKPNPKITRE